MPRPKRGPYLKVRKQKRNGEKVARDVYYIIDGDRRISTGFLSPKEKKQAEEALETHIRAKFIQPPGEEYYVAQAIDLYRQDVVPKHTRPEETEQHLTRLMEFFKGRTCESVTPALTAAYERWRTHTGKPFLGEPPRDRPPIKPGSVRRDLEMLRAAFNHAYKSRKLKHPIPITLPAKSPPRERWLTRSEAARLLAASLGFVLAPCSDLATRRERLTIWRREPMVTSRHLARFILIGLRTGTRSGAILDLGWRQHPKGGFFDLDREPALMTRAAPRERETKKRKPKAPVPSKLLPHLQRWKAQSDGLYVVAMPGAEDTPINRVTTAFNAAVVRAGLDREVNRHTLRHTCVTWLMQKGQSAFDVGHFVGMSVQTVIERYGHHAPDYLQETANAA